MLAVRSAPMAVEVAHRHVSRLMLTDFRCYERVVLALRPGPVVLSGPNGAGKTNILEAVSLLSPGRGLRHAKAADMARMGGSGGFAVAATIEGADLVAPLDLGTATAGDGERRIVKRAGAMATQASLARDLSILWLTPTMDRIWTEGAAGRRRFLDRLVLARRPSHAEAHIAYDKARDERMRLLLNGPRDATWLAAIEERAAKAGAAIAMARRGAVAELNAEMAAAETPFPAAELTLTGEVEGWAETEEAALAARLKAALAATRGRDAEAGVQVTGPHRGDMTARHVAKDLPASHCSTGEQKALLIAIVLAQAALVARAEGRAPILLLDEVAAHIDPGRRQMLYDLISGRGLQAFLTGTERSLFHGLEDRGQFFDVRDGQVAAAS